MHRREDVCLQFAARHFHIEKSIFGGLQILHPGHQQEQSSLKLLLAVERKKTGTYAPEAGHRLIQHTCTILCLYMILIVISCLDMST